MVVALIGRTDEGEAGLHGSMNLVELDAVATADEHDVEEVRAVVDDDVRNGQSGVDDRTRFLFSGDEVLEQMVRRYVEALGQDLGQPVEEFLDVDGFLDVENLGLTDEVIEPVQGHAVPFEGYAPQLVLETGPPRNVAVRYAFDHVHEGGLAIYPVLDVADVPDSGQQGEGLGQDEGFRSHAGDDERVRDDGP